MDTPLVTIEAVTAMLRQTPDEGLVVLVHADDRDRIQAAIDAIPADERRPVRVEVSKLGPGLPRPGEVLVIDVDRTKSAMASWLVPDEAFQQAGVDPHGMCACEVMAPTLPLGRFCPVCGRRRWRALDPPLRITDVTG